MDATARTVSGGTELSAKQIVGMVILVGSLGIPLILIISYLMYSAGKEKDWVLLIKAFWIIALLVGVCLLLA